MLNFLKSLIGWINQVFRFQENQLPKDIAGRIEYWRLHPDEYRVIGGVPRSQYLNSLGESNDEIWLKRILGSRGQYIGDDFLIFEINHDLRQVVEIAITFELLMRYCNNDVRKAMETFKGDFSDHESPNNTLYYIDAFINGVSARFVFDKRFESSRQWILMNLMNAQIILEDSIKFLPEILDDYENKDVNKE